MKHLKGELSCLLWETCSSYSSVESWIDDKVDYKTFADFSDYLAQKGLASNSLASSLSQPRWELNGHCTPLQLGHTSLPESIFLQNSVDELLPRLTTQEER